MTITFLPPIPDAPRELVLAAEQGRLVPFIGAGISQIAGCPGWLQFADKALEFCSVPSDLMKQIKCRNLSPRIRLALAERMAANAKRPIDYDAILHPPGWDASVKGNEIYQALGGISRNFVTTNYDKWLDTYAPTPTTSSSSAATLPTSRVARDAIYRPELIEYSQLDRDAIHTVIHLHGSVLDPTSMVMSTQHYIERYAFRGDALAEARHTTTQLFLEYLFRLKSVLFVGYGLDELEILEYVILKAKSRAGPHFILQSFQAHEVDLANHMADYFRHECGVTLIPFLRIGHDYSGLIEVVKHFATNLTVGPVPKLERRFTLDTLLDSDA